MSNTVLKDFLVAFRSYDTVDVQAVDPVTQQPIFNEAGEPMMVKAKVKTRENFTASVPVPTAAGIIAMLQGDNPAVRDLLVNHVHSLVYAQLRAQTDAEVNPANSTADLDLAKLDIAAIAAMKPEDRGSAKFKVTDEYRTAFTAAFVELMPAAGLLTSAQAGAVAEVFCKGYAGYRSNEAALSKFRLRIEQFTGLVTPDQLDELAPMLEHLDSQAEKYLATMQVDLNNLLGL